MIYRSKKDLWLVALVWGGVLAPLAIGVFNLFAPGGNLELGWALTRVSVVVAATVVILTFPLNYEITAMHLVARSGVMRWRVPLDSIQNVRPSRNPASAPTWSLDRLRVEYLKGDSTRSLFISPEDKQIFMRDLADGVPGLEVRGDGVVRVG
jgi:hypothetical protein